MNSKTAANGRGHTHRVARCSALAAAYVLLLLCAPAGHLRATTLASNLSEDDNGGTPVIAGSPIAGAFKTPAGVTTVTLSSVTLPLKASNTSGVFTVKIHPVNGMPDAFTGSNAPESGGTPTALSSPAISVSGSYASYVFTPVGGGSIALQPDSWYWVSAETTSVGSYTWGSTDSAVGTPDPIYAGYSQFTSGIGWEIFDGFGQQRFTVEGTATNDGGTTYFSWSGGAAQNADANKDGITNLMAYALGAPDINTHAVHLLPVFTKVTGGYKYSAPTTTRTDVIYEVQMSTTLAGSSWASGVLARKPIGGSWAAGDITSGITVTPTANGVEVTDTNGGNKRFWRLSATVP